MEENLNPLSKERQKKFLRKFVKSPLIPVQVGVPPEMNKEYLDRYLTHLGFTVYESDSEYFFAVEFPKGWSKILVPGMLQWCYLVDNKGKKRAAIFYQDLGSFADEELPVEQRGKQFRKVSSHINWMPRYRSKIDHVIPYNIWKGANQTVEHYNSPLVGMVVDSETNVLYKTGMANMSFDYGKEKEKWFIEEKQLRDMLFVECEDWLKQNYPEYENIAAYWR